MDDAITPADLSRELSIPAINIRNYLRERYGLLQPPETRWRLTPQQADDVRRHFSS